MNKENLTQVTAPEKAMGETEKEKALEIFQRAMVGELFVSIGRSLGISAMRAREIAERTWRVDHPEHYKKHRGQISALRKNPIVEAERVEAGEVSGE